MLLAVAVLRMRCDLVAAEAGGADAPRTRRTRNMSAERRAGPLTVATWNVHGGVGRDRRYAPARIATSCSKRAPTSSRCRKSARATPASPARCARARNGLPRRRRMDVQAPRLRFRQRRAVALSRSTRRSGSTSRVEGREPRGALDVVVNAPQGALRMIGTHLGLLPGERRMQVKRLLARSSNASAACRRCSPAT